MEEVCERANLKEALRQVRSNKGSAGVDRITVDQLGDYLKQHWPAIREQLLMGTYEPKPVRRVEIPKPEGGVRKLGIPTVLDRFLEPRLRLNRILSSRRKLSRRLVRSALFEAVLCK